MDLLDLSNKTILITGGCGAIGRVVVATLARHNARVAVNDIIPEQEATVILNNVGATGDNVAYFRADGTQADAVSDLFNQIGKHWSLPTVVCCHAGMVEAFPVAEYPLDKFDALLNLNLRSGFVVAQEASRRWKDTNVPGHLIFTTSWVQDVPWPEITPYTTSKAGLKAMMRGFARELAPHQIRANAVAPGIVAVGLAKRQWDTDPSYKARAQKAIPLGAMQPPETVANAFLFLASQMADYMTGSVLLVDGGCSLYPMD
jgi:NAD(P)-dependent dehydrogenase (short-subunit alcohol dehydrogenase family)